MALKCKCVFGTEESQQNTLYNTLSVQGTMSVASHVGPQLAQSTTTIAKTPQPSTIVGPSTTQSIQKESNARLELYNSLFGQGSNKKCDETGLPFESSLNYSLQTFLFTKDTCWVLAMIDIADSDNFDEKYGYRRKQRKIIQIAMSLKNFVKMIQGN